MQRPTAEIHIRGPLAPDAVAELGVAVQIAEPAETVLLTSAVDQDGLHRVIAALEALGVELLELRRAASAVPAHGSQAGDSGRDHA